MEAARQAQDQAEARAAAQQEEEDDEGDDDEEQLAAERAEEELAALEELEVSRTKPTSGVGMTTDAT